MSPRFAQFKHLSQRARQILGSSAAKPSPSSRAVATGPARVGGSLPSLPIYAVTWGIEEHFGGMTNVLFHRAGSFAAHDGRTVVVLSFAAGQDSSTLSDRLRANGHLRDGVVLRNLWEDLADYDSHELASLKGRGQVSKLPALPKSHTAQETLGGRAMDYIEDGSGRLLRREHLRRDGSVSVIDDRVSAKRTFTLMGRAGESLAQWRSARGLYFAWLDHVTGVDPCILINDSKYAGGFLWAYQRSNARVVHVHHSIHLSVGATLNGPYPKSRLGVLRNHEQYDLVTFLTHRQLSDFAATGIDTRNTAVIPNSRAQAPTEVGDHIRGRGACLARLTPDKQVDHQVRAVSALAQSHHNLSLDVFGNGTESGRLERLIGESSGAGRVHLRGFVPGAAKELANYDFLMLTSKYEGMGLVLLEAMATGCIPISYDIRYGPSDIITDGVDGILVADRTVEGLKAALERYLSLDDETVAKMRSAARRRAADFSDEAVTKTWGKYLSNLPTRTPVGGQATDHGDLVITGFDSDGDDLLVSYSGTPTSESVTHGLALVVSSTNERSFTKLRADISAQDNQGVIRIPRGSFAGKENAPFTMSWQLVGAPWASQAPVRLAPGVGAPLRVGAYSVGVAEDGAVTLAVTG